MGNGFILDTSPVRQMAQPNALNAGRYVLDVSVYSSNAPTTRRFIEMTFPGQFTTVLDGHAESALAGVTLVLRRLSPKEGHLDDVEQPASRPSDDERGDDAGHSSG